VDFSEWHEATSNDEALEELRAVLAVFDRPLSARRPAALTRVLKDYGLLAGKPESLAFALALAGASANGAPVPWLRERRPRREPGETRNWVSDGSRYFVSGNGRVVIATATTRTHLHSILRLTRADGRWCELPVEAATGTVHPTAVSHDGSVVSGCWQASEDEPTEAFRWLDGDVVERLPREPGHVVIPTACSTDGSVLVGWSEARDAGQGRSRAWRWRERHGAGNISAPDGAARASHVSADGRRIAGTHGGEHATNRAFVWSEDGGFTDLGIEGVVVDWFDFAPDGTSGVLRVSRGQRDELDVWRWRDGTPLEPAPGALNPLPQDDTVRVVGDATRAVKASLAGAPTRIDERGLREVYVRYRAPDGSWLFATRLGDGYGVVQFLIWQGDSGWQAWDIGLREDWIDVHATSRAESSDSLVVLAAPRRGLAPFLWTPLGGVESFPDSI
jgi:hypothetical protein